jgi:hypothetical protein
MFVMSPEMHHSASLRLIKRKGGELALGSPDYSVYWNDQYEDDGGSIGRAVTDHHRFEVIRGRHPVTVFRRAEREQVGAEPHVESPAPSQQLQRSTAPNRQPQRRRIGHCLRMRGCGRRRRFGLRHRSRSGRSDRRTRTCEDERRDDERQAPPGVELHESDDSIAPAVIACTRAVAVAPKATHFALHPLGEGQCLCAVSLAPRSAPSAAVCSRSAPSSRSPVRRIYISLSSVFPSRTLRADPGEDPRLHHRAYRCCAAPGVSTSSPRVGLTPASYGHSREVRRWANS